VSRIKECVSASKRFVWFDRRKAERFTITERGSIAIQAFTLAENGRMFSY
jgi:hypothetical protein